MAIGNKEFLGKLISEELGEYLRKYTSKFDRIRVSEMEGVNVGASTIREVMYRNSNLTADNSVAINELMKIAIQNCMAEKQAAVRAERSLKSLHNKFRKVVG